MLSLNTPRQSQPRSWTLPAQNLLCRSSSCRRVSWISLPWTSWKHLPMISAIQWSTQWCGLFVSCHGFHTSPTYSSRSWIQRQGIWGHYRFRARQQTSRTWRCRWLNSFSSTTGSIWRKGWRAWRVISMVMVMERYKPRALLHFKSIISIKTVNSIPEKHGTGNPIPLGYCTAIV